MKLKDIFTTDLLREQGKQIFNFFEFLESLCVITEGGEVVGHTIEFFNDLKKDEMLMLDQEYLLIHSGEKTLVENLFKFKNKEESEVVDTTCVEVTSILAKAKYTTKWNGLYKTYLEAKEGLLNYKSKTIVTPDIQNELINSNSETYNVGFNSTTPTQTGKVTSSSKTKQTGTNKSETEGLMNKSPSMALMEQVEAMKWNFFETIFDDIDKLITLPKYEID